MRRRAGTAQTAREQHVRGDRGSAAASADDTEAQAQDGGAKRSQLHIEAWTAPRSRPRTCAAEQSMRGSRALSACRRKRRSGRVRRGAGLGAPASPSRACGHPALSRRTLRRVARTLAAKRAGEARSAIWERTRRRGGRSPHPRDAVGGSSTFELHRSVGRLAAAASEGVSPNLVAAVPMRPNPRVGAGVVVEIWPDR